MCKKILLCFFVSIGIMLAFNGCTNSVNMMKIEMDDIITIIEKGDNKDIVLKTKDEEITKETLVCYCKFIANVNGDENYSSNEVIEETVESIALAKEAEKRKIQIPDEIKNEVESYTDEYVQNKYGSDYPLETYKNICVIAYLNSEILEPIQDEIMSGEISIDDENTKNLSEKFMSYQKDVSSKSENWSDDQKLEEMKKFYAMYDEVEKAYIDYLIATHLSSTK